MEKFKEIYFLVYNWFENKKLFLTYAVFAFIGCLDISISWYLLACFLDLWYRYYSFDKNLSDVIKEFLLELNSEQKTEIHVKSKSASTSNLENKTKKMPGKCYTLQADNTDSMQWANVIIKRLWNVCIYPVITKENVNKALVIICEQFGPEKSVMMEHIRMTHCEFGDCPLEFTDANVSTETRRITLDLGIKCDLSKTNLQLKWSRQMLGVVKNLGFCTKIRVSLDSLQSNLEIYKHIGITLLDQPQIHLETRLGPANLLFKLPVDSIVNIGKRIIVDMFLLKPRHVVYIADSGDDNDLVATQPIGLLRVVVVEAKDLIVADRTLCSMVGLSKGSSDPYCEVQLGRIIARTKTIHKTLNPTWNFYCEFSVPSSGLRGKELHIKMKDEDYGILNVDDQLGSSSIDLSKLSVDTVADIWINLKSVDIETGNVRLKLQWVPCLSSHNYISNWHREFQNNISMEPCSRAILVVHIKSVTSTTTLTPLVTIQIMGKDFQTTAKGFPCTKWVFEEELHVLVPNPETDWICMRLINYDTGTFFKDANEFFQSLMVDRTSDKRNMAAKESLKDLTIVAEGIFPVRMFAQKRTVDKLFKFCQYDDPTHVIVNFVAQLYFVDTPKINIF